MLKLWVLETSKNLLIRQIHIKYNRQGVSDSFVSPISLVENCLINIETNHRCVTEKLLPTSLLPFNAEVHIFNALFFYCCAEKRSVSLHIVQWSCSKIIFNFRIKLNTLISSEMSRIFKRSRRKPNSCFGNVLWKHLLMASSILHNSRKFQLLKGLRDRLKN